MVKLPPKPIPQTTAKKAPPYSMTRVSAQRISPVRTSSGVSGVVSIAS